MSFAFGFGEEPTSEDASSQKDSAITHRRSAEIRWPVDSPLDEVVDRIKLLGHEGRILQLDKVRVADETTDGSDLIAGVYEGGLKLWECSLDLVALLDAPQWRDSAVKGAKVMELGCGHGLPGLTALHFGASQVHFQDFDQDVICRVTMANARIGGYPKVGTDAVRFYAGDWATLLESLPNESAESYDLILTAETVYSTESLPRLARCIVSLLKPVSGTALVAAKRYYFGVGGGFAAFERELSVAAARAQKKVVSSSEPLVEIQDGQSNVREIRAVSLVADSA